MLLSHKHFDIFFYYGNAEVLLQRILSNNIFFTISSTLIPLFNLKTTRGSLQLVAPPHCNFR